MKRRWIYIVTIITIMLTAGINSNSRGQTTKVTMEEAITGISAKMIGQFAGAKITTIGISEFTPSGGDALKLGPYISDKLTAAIVQGGQVDVIERAKMDVLMEEIRKGQKGIIDPKSAQKVGKVLGIQAFVMGTYTALDKSADVTAKLVATETGKVLAVSNVTIKLEDDLEALLKPLVSPKPLQLEATLLVQRKTDRGWEGVMVRDGDTLQTNDNMKVFFRTNEDCYVYVILFGASGEVEVVFPNKSVNMSNRAEGKRDYYIPPDKDWFFLDDKTGTETVFIVASYEPLRDLEKLLLQMAQAGQDKKKVAAKKVEQNLEVQTRGIGGVRPGETISITTNDGKKIEKVTEVVEGKVKAVRKISFQHR